MYLEAIHNFVEVCMRAKHSKHFKRTEVKSGVFCAYNIIMKLFQKKNRLLCLLKFNFCVFIFRKRLKSFLISD